jgi:AraC-like DNA-binding protein
MNNIPIREIKPSASEPKISQTFRIRDLAKILGGKDMSQDTHRHNFFFVLALKKGQGNHVIDFVPYKVGNNCIFIIRPGQVHQLELHAACTGFLVEFNMEFYHLNDRGTGHVLRKATTTSFCQLTDSAFDRLNNILQDIYQEYTDSREGYNEIIRAHLDIFFIEFLRNREQSNPSTKATSYEQERFDEFLGLVETNVSTKKQVSAYAEMLNISGYQLSAITKNVLGKTPSDIINEQIILEAKRYLLTTSDQVNQIAGHLGYEDASYFIRFFKKHTGHSPESFRVNSK